MVADAPMLTRSRRLLRRTDLVHDWLRNSRRARRNERRRETNAWRRELRAGTL